MNNIRKHWTLDVDFPTLTKVHSTRAPLPTGPTVERANEGEIQ